MRNGLAPILLAAASAVFVTFLVVVDTQLTSPGPISITHANVEELSADSCELCHGYDKFTLANACKGCHGTVAQQIFDKNGFHGRLPLVQDCGRCHVEHNGAAVRLVDARAFALAGFEVRDDYAHEGLDFLLTGEHLERKCEECHPNADAPALETGEQRFRGAPQECVGCHEDPHEGRMIEGCQSCHGQEKPFKDLDGFLHRKAFPLEGVHGKSECVDCHKPETEHAVEKLGTRDSAPQRECAACHESPHSEPFIAQVASMLEVEGPTTCATCHPLNLSVEAFTDFDAASMNRLHIASGFDLAAPHDQVECVNCHTEPHRLPDTESGAEPAPKSYTEQRSATDCAACHTSPHGTQFDEGPFAGFDCLACHDRGHFVPASFDAEQHSKTEFPLTAGHSYSECVDCHTPAPDEPFGSTNFADRSRLCADCHDSAHDGLLTASLPDQSSPEACDTCHLTTTFDDHGGGEFDHTLWTAFALEGSHLEAECDVCHVRSTEPDDLGRRFGRIAEVFGSPTTDCATCHFNVHVGQMAGTSGDCSECHNSTSFDQFDESRFSHGEATGFALIGAHSRAKCTTCHVPTSQRDENHRSFGLVTEASGNEAQDCKDCHEDPHAGRFLRLRNSSHPKERVDCVTCHNQEDFKGSIASHFDHDLWTPFPLVESHLKVECGACHVIPTVEKIGLTPGTSCAACHIDSHYGQFGYGEAARCERCHQSQTSFSTLVFDHEKDSRFALDERHAKLKCVACHKSWPMEDGGEAVRYKPLGMECADCHIGEIPQ